MLKTHKMFECPRCKSTLSIVVTTKNYAHISRFEVTEDITEFFRAIMSSTYKAFLENHDLEKEEVKKHIDSALRSFRRAPKELQALVYRTIEPWGRDDFINFDGIEELLWRATHP